MGGILSIDGELRRERGFEMSDLEAKKFSDAERFDRVGDELFMMVPLF